MKPISQDTVNNVLSLLDSGLTGREIATRLGISTGKVSNIRSKHRPDLEKAKGGRPPHMSDGDIRLAARLITSGKADNAAQLREVFQEVTDRDVKPHTLRRGLTKAGLVSRTKVKRPLLTEQHRRARFEWAERHKEWTQADWDSVIWSDESKINRIDSDGLKWVWVQPGEGLSDRIVTPTVKFGGGSIMIWGCFHAGGVGDLVLIEGKMDAQLYTEILEDNLLASIADYGLKKKDIVFQQDNDPKHTSKKAKDWFNKQKIELMKWPAQSPDLNPIEHLWAIVKRKLAAYPKPPSGVRELWERIQDVWSKITPEECRRLVDSMPSRVAAVLAAHGGYTDY